jgi:hypothetical protein
MYGPAVRCKRLWSTLADAVTFQSTRTRRRREQYMPLVAFCLRHFLADASLISDRNKGLDQELNSLDARYDAASAYIRSQAHAGWTLIRSRYDDGGYSGGSTDRPDLQRLLDDIRARKIDVIVVYKVDRLPSPYTLQRWFARHRCRA